MSLRWLIGAVIAALALLSGPVHAGDASDLPGTTPPSSTSSLILSIRARALGLDSVLEPASSLGLEPVKAPTGAGTDRMPSATTEIARGVYLTVMPACLPGVDDVGGRPFPRRLGQPPRPR